MGLCWIGALATGIFFVSLDKRAYGDALLCNGAETHEKFIMSKIRAGESIVGIYPPSAETDKEMEEWMAKHVEVCDRRHICLPACE